MKDTRLGEISRFCELGLLLLERCFSNDPVRAVEADFSCKALLRVV